MDAGKKSFLWMVAIFFTPVLLGTLLFFNLDRLGLKRPSVNYGDLVHPAFLLKTDGLMEENGEAKAEIKKTLSKKWTLLYIEPENCDQICIDRLALIKRVRLLTNEDMRRVRTTLISTKENLLGIDKQEYYNLVLASIDSGSTDFLNQFPAQDKHPVYLIDPLGNLMMYYSQTNPDIKKMLKDLKRLLKYVQLGSE